MFVHGTHVGSRPLLAGQLLLLRAGGGHLQVEHGFQPGGASVDPLAPLIVLTQQERALNPHRLHRTRGGGGLF